MQYAPDPEVTPFVVIAVLATVAACGRVAAARDRGHAAAGASRLTPRVPRVPRALWRTFGLSALGVLASWSVGGLYLSLGPGIIGAAPCDDQNHAIGGLFVFVFSAFAVLAQWLLPRRRDAADRGRRGRACSPSAA